MNFSLIDQYIYIFSRVGEFLFNRPVYIRFSRVGEFLFNRPVYIRFSRVGEFLFNKPVYIRFSRVGDLKKQTNKRQINTFRNM